MKIHILIVFRKKWEKNQEKLTYVKPVDRLYPAEDEDNKDNSNCKLMYLNEATLLNNVKLRYQKGKIDTDVANIFIAVNPYYNIPDHYWTNTIRKFIHINRQEPTNSDVQSMHVDLPWC